jgi:hypothetical protein
VSLFSGVGKERHEKKKPGRVADEDTKYIILH